MAASRPREVKTDEFTLKSGHLDVGDGHEIYFEQWGNPKAKYPILSFHGGPGSRYKPRHKAIFDPRVHQLILFDQRGAGNSLPYGKLENNTTQDLILDAVKILKHLNIKKVNVSGGSWGSTLALLFAIEQPEYVKTVIIRGVFTGSQEEIDYLDKGLFRRFYPEVWERFKASVPDEFAENPAQYHYKILNGKETSKYAASSKALEDLEVPLLIYDWRGYDDIKHDKDPSAKADEFDFVPYRIYAHYLSQGCFMPDNYIFDNAHKIKAPLYIVQGRYDMVCPPITAYRIHKNVAGSKLFITLSSHDFDPENRSALRSLVETVL